MGGIDAFMIDVWWNFDEMQIIFKAITGSFGYAAGRSSTFFYFSLLLLSIVVFAGRSSTFFYFSLLLSIVLSTGRYSTFFYFSLLLSIVLSAGRSSTFFYSSLLLLSIVLSAGRSSTFFYFSLLLLSIVLSAGRSSTFFYSSLLLLSLFWCSRWRYWRIFTNCFTLGAVVLGGIMTGGGPQQHALWVLSEPDTRKIEKEGLVNWLGWKCTLHPVHTSNWLLMSILMCIYNYYTVPLPLALHGMIASNYPLY